MRILAVHPGPAFSVADVHTGWVKAFRKAGHEVADVNLGDRLDSLAAAHVNKGTSDAPNWVKAFPDQAVVLIAAQTIKGDVLDFKPDVVFLTSAFFVPLDVLDQLRSSGIKVVILHTESPYEDDIQVERAQHADLNFVNDPTNIGRFPNAMYQWHCYDPDIHKPAPVKTADHVSDFVFVGTAYPSRVAFLEQVNWTGIDVAFAGNWQTLKKDSPLRKFVAHDIKQCLDNDQAVDLYVATKLSANLYRHEAQRPELSAGWSMGPREVELAACQVPFLREPRAEGDEVLSMLPTFDSPTTFEEHLRMLLGDRTQRVLLGQWAADAVAERTFDNAAQRLLTLL